MYSSATSQKGWLMPKALCLIGMAIAIVVFLVFLLDLVFGMSGMREMAPFQNASTLIDIMFMISAAALAYMAWATFREQK